ncbi:DUF5677 domain-containing protein [Pseudomonas quasicaspiana]|uniref:DUF5677 domain-containing protein n=1 Tax=Pseudomonas quasicaspiana TaxID=2829821 RepID=UPI001E50439D|nr:DUF5677 domain-containing protein [Pseudomonas quasicaspiana]MCD5972323.1 hypothetical protein [Pseudomonas quasicaspiana]
MQWELPPAGFLSSEADELVPIVLQANERFFALAKDVNQLMMAMAQESLNTVQTSSMADDAVLVRLLMRAAGFYQGALLMAERGMYVECRAMARSVIEVSLAVAAMGGDKATFMQMLRDDHLKSRRNRYLTLHTHSTDPGTRKTAPPKSSHVLGIGQRDAFASQDRAENFHDLRLSDEGFHQAYNDCLRR